jgi:DNA-binding MarR family transcriptional regulator
MNRKTCLQCTTFRKRVSRPGFNDFSLDPVNLFPYRQQQKEVALEEIKSSKYATLFQLSKRIKGLDTASAESCLDLMRAAWDVRQFMEERFFRTNISEGRFTVLALLLGAKDWTLTPSELAAGSGVTRATMTGLLDGLENEGMLERKAFKNDRRKTAVKLTTKGRDFLLELLPGFFGLLAELGSGLSDSQRKTLVRLLDTISTA